MPSVVEAVRTIVDSVVALYQERERLVSQLEPRYRTDESRAVDQISRYIAELRPYIEAADEADQEVLIEELQRIQTAHDQLERFLAEFTENKPGITKAVRLERLFSRLEFACLRARQEPRQKKIRTASSPRDISPPAVPENPTAILCLLRQPSLGEAGLVEVVTATGSLRLELQMHRTQRGYASQEWCILKAMSQPQYRNRALTMSQISRISDIRYSNVATTSRRLIERLPSVFLQLSRGGKTWYVLAIAEAQIAEEPLADA